MLEKLTIIKEKNIDNSPITIQQIKIRIKKNNKYNYPNKYIQNITNIKNNILNNIIKNIRKNILNNILNILKNSLNNIINNILTNILNNNVNILKNIKSLKFSIKPQILIKSVTIHQKILENKITHNSQDCELI